jgi:hypothetical protein
MDRVEKLENEVQSLSEKELADFRAWFQEFDWRKWDAELGRDIDAGRLDLLAEQALDEHRAGHTKPL